MPFSTDSDILHNLGIYRVIEPWGSLPQAAWKLDNTPVAQYSETLVEVHALHMETLRYSYCVIIPYCELSLPSGSASSA